MKKNVPEPQAVSKDWHFERFVYHLLDHRLGEPVGRVVFTKPLPRLGANHGLIEHFHHVLFDVAPIEPAEPPRQGAAEFFAPLDLQHPVEEIGLDNTVHATLVELRTRQQRRGVQPLHRQAQHRMRDDLG